MIYVLCLESKDLMVTKEQVFASTLFCIMKETFSLFNKISIISPANCENAKYNSILKYDSSLEEEFITNFIEQYGLTLSFAVLNKLPNKDIEDLYSLKYYLGDILLQAYANPNLPNLINISDINIYIEKIGLSIRDKVLEYYNSILNEVQ